MQTFIPYPDMDASARVLDRQRLGKQRVEAWQILRALTDPSYGWQHHPAVQMWRGYERALVAYYAAICREWTRRGYQHNMPVLVPEPLSADDLPSWWGQENVHRSHRAMLFHKAPAHYVGFTGAGKAEYVWPV